MDKLDLNERIAQLYPRMSKGQRRIADFITENYDKAAFMTAVRLAERAGVSESTVVRFAFVLGYEGYPVLQRALQEMIRNRLTAIQRIELTEDLDRGHVLRSVMKADVNSIRETIENIDDAVFQQVIDTMFVSRDIYIIGVRSAAPLAAFLSHYLSLVFPGHVKNVVSGVSDVFEQVMQIGREDMIIGISYPRYSNRTVECMQLARSRQAKLVAITDSPDAPIAGISDMTLIGCSTMTSFVDSMVSPMSIINALVVATALQKKDQVSSYLSELEQVWEQYHVYIERSGGSEGRRAD